MDTGRESSETGDVFSADNETPPPPPPPAPPPRSWLWGFHRHRPLIEPRPWKLNHLIGDAYEKDLRRHIWGYWLLAVFPFIPIVAGAAAGAVAARYPQWELFSDTAAMGLVAVGAIVAVIGYALISIRTEPPESVSLRIPLDWELP